MQEIFGSKRLHHSLSISFTVYGQYGDNSLANIVSATKVLMNGINEIKEKANLVFSLGNWAI